MKKLLLLLLLLSPLFVNGQIDLYTVRARKQLKTDSIFVIGNDTIKFINPIEDNQVIQRVNGKWINKVLGNVLASETIYDPTGTIYDSTTVQGALTQIGKKFNDGSGGFTNVIHVTKEKSIQSIIDTITKDSYPDNKYLLVLENSLFSESVVIENKFISITTDSYNEAILQRLDITLNEPGDQISQISNIIIDTLIINFENPNYNKIVTLNEITVRNYMEINGENNFYHVILNRNSRILCKCKIKDVFYDSNLSGYSSGINLSGKAVAQHGSAEINDTVVLNDSSKFYVRSADVRAFPEISAVTYVLNGAKVYLNTDANSQSQSEIILNSGASEKNIEFMTQLYGGVIEESNITKINDTIYIPESTIGIYDNDNNARMARRFIMPDTGLKIQQGTSQNIEVFYNSGNPVYTINQSPLSNNSDRIPVFTVLNDTTSGTNTFHVNSYNEFGKGLPEKILKWINALFPFEVKSGFGTVEVIPNRYITVSSGIVFNSVKQINLASFNSELDSLTYFYKKNGIWATLKRKRYNNNFYDNGTDTIAATTGRYIVNYFFKDSDGGEVYHTTSPNQYTSLELAKLDPFPTVLPTLIKEHSFRIARIIVLKGATSGEVENLLDKVSTGAGGILNHNDLSGIDGNGTYHLNNTAFLALIDPNSQLPNLHTDGNSIFNSTTITQPVNITSPSNLVPRSQDIFNYVENRQAPIYSLELSVNGQNNISIPFTIKTGAIVYYNDDKLGENRWSGEGTAILILDFPTYKYDKIFIKND